MTGLELAQTRTKLGLSKPQLAVMLDVHPGTIHQWEKGARPIPGVVRVAMTALGRTVPGATSALVRADAIEALDLAAGYLSQIGQRLKQPRLRNRNGHPELTAADTRPRRARGRLIS